MFDVALASTVANPVLPCMFSTLVLVPATLANNAMLLLLFVLVMLTSPASSFISKFPPPPIVKLPCISTLPLGFEPTVTKSVPSYTLIFSTVAFASYQSWPLIGLAGLVPNAKFSSICTKFSLVASP